MKSILIIFATILMAQCTKKSVPAVSNGSAEAIKYLALGDSYTIGESVGTGERWPVQLSEQLKSKGLAINSPQIIAQTGWTTDELNQGINKTAPEKNFDLVSLLIGVNNQFRGRSVTDFKREFEPLLDRAIAFAGGNKSKVFVVSIPDYGFTPFGQGRNPEKITREIDEYNQVQKDICTARNIAFFDITPISREGLKDPELVAGDGLHPSGKMYGQWVDLMLNDILTLAK